MQGTVTRTLSPTDRRARKYLGMYKGQRICLFRERHDSKKRLSFDTVETVIPGSERFHDEEAARDFNRIMNWDTSIHSV